MPDEPHTATDAPGPPPRSAGWAAALRHPLLYAALLVASIASFDKGLLPAEEPPSLPSALPSLAFEPIARRPAELPFGFAAALVIPVVVGSGLLVGYVLLRAHNVRVFPRCEFPLVPWTAGSLVGVGIVLFAAARGAGLGLAWLLHAQETRGALPWLPRGLAVLGAANLTMLAVCLFTVALVGSAHGGPLRLLGLCEAQPLRRALMGLAGILMVLPLVLAAAYVALSLAPRVGLSARPQEVLVQAAEASPRALAFVLLSIVAVTPAMEELLFRGFFYATLRRYLGPLGAILLSSLTFAVLHGHPVGIPPLFVVGFLLAYLYERTGSLVASVTAHAAYNVYILLLAHLARRALGG
ncbi:MAG: CPBP family intramembrane metalloprotease [Planctomycetes bacterium]|nr:CPBP family intramembrane metalloprotease [Planctomycetota bacterium]